MILFRKDVHFPLLHSPVRCQLRVHTGEGELHCAARPHFLYPASLGTLTVGLFASLGFDHDVDR